MKVKVLLPTLLSLAAGAMMFVIINELIPESQNSNRKNIMTLITILGFVFMMILDIALG
jgi:ZIP family zinc transporter